MLLPDVRQDSGKTVRWQFELGSPNGLEREGFTRHTLKPGDSITVRAFPAKDGTKLGNAFRIDRSDGAPALKAGPDRYPSTR